MHVAIDIERSEGPMARKVYTFALFSTTFVLSNYVEQYKVGYSGKWRNKTLYDRVVSQANTIEAEQINIPQDVKDELIKTFTSQLTVKTWKNYSKPKG